LSSPPIRRAGLFRELVDCRSEFGRERRNRRRGSGTGRNAPIRHEPIDCNRYRHKGKKLFNS
jgi:hypothetical protein